MLKLLKKVITNTTLKEGMFSALFVIASLLKMAFIAGFVIFPAFIFTVGVGYSMDVGAETFFRQIVEFFSEIDNENLTENVGAFIERLQEIWVLFTGIIFMIWLVFRGASLPLLQAARFNKSVLHEYSRETYRIPSENTNPQQESRQEPEK